MFPKKFTDKELAGQFVNLPDSTPFLILKTNDSLRTEVDLEVRLVIFPDKKKQLN